MLIHCLAAICILIELLEIRNGAIDLLARCVENVLAALQHTGALRVPHVFAFIEAKVVTILLGGQRFVKGVHVPFIATSHVENCTDR